MSWMTTAHAKDSMRRHPSPFRFLPHLTRRRRPSDVLHRARGRNPDACRQIGLSDGNSPSRERQAFDLNVRGDGCTHDGSKLAFFRTSVAQPRLRARTSRCAQACARMPICRLNALPPTWRISQLLFAGTLANARGAYQMPIRHRGHAGLRRAGQDARCSLRSAPQPSPFPRSMGQCAHLPAGTTAFDRPFASGECIAMVRRSPVALPAKAIAAMWRISTFSNRSTRMKLQGSRTLVRRSGRVKCKWSETSIPLLSDQLIACEKFE
jgi:hypothetical protein